MLRLLTMFGPFAAAKFWISVVMAVVQFLQVYFGVDFGLDQETVTAVLGGLWAILVWLLPNDKPKTPVPVPVNDPNYYPPKPGLY